MTAIINLDEAARRLFLLGLDTKEIADALSLSEIAICDALERHRQPGEAVI
mgnify:CR=1 FL=1